MARENIDQVQYLNTIGISIFLRKRKKSQTPEQLADSEAPRRDKITKDHSQIPTLSSSGEGSLFMDFFLFMGVWERQSSRATVGPDT